MKRWTQFVLCVGWATGLVAAPLPYDEAADSHVDLEHALQLAQNEHKDVLIIFGANWCEDCRDLDKAMHGSSASVIKSRFVLVKIDVGNFDKNLDLAKYYGDPIHKGIPAAVVVSPSDQVLYATKAGELADARHMSEQSIYAFFTNVLPAGK